MTDVIYSYSTQQAIEDGVLFEVFKNRWEQLSGGKPIVASIGVNAEISEAGLLEIWNAYVTWKSRPHDREDSIFNAFMNDKTIWVMEDPGQITILYPSEY